MRHRSCSGVLLLARMRNHRQSGTLHLLQSESPAVPLGMKHLLEMANPKLVNGLAPLQTFLGLEASSLAIQSPEAIERDLYLSHQR